MPGALGCRTPGPKSRNWIRRDERVISPSMTRDYNFVYDRAKGMHIWDADGNKFLDFAASVAVMNLGHADPAVVKAVKAQAGKGMHAAFPDFYARLPVKFVEKLLSFTSHYQKVFLSNSGTEAVECNLKLAKWHTRKKWFVSFDHAFHGRTMGSLSLTHSKPVHRKHFGPFIPVKHAPFPDPYRSKHPERPEEAAKESLQAVKRIFRQKSGDVAGVMAEPIQGEGGYIVPPKTFHRDLKRLCEDYGVLFCADEVQAGCYRTGTFLAMENFRVKADITSLSKAIGGGVPLGATLSSNEIMSWPVGAHANTFGGNLLACAGGLVTLQEMRRRRVGENAKKVGTHLLKKLKKLEDRYEQVGDVRGIGLMIGVEFVKDKRTKRPDPAFRDAVLCAAHLKGLLLLPAGNSVVRICPPLILTKKEADLGYAIFEEAIAQASTGWRP